MIDDDDSGDMRLKGNEMNATGEPVLDGTTRGEAFEVLVGKMKDWIAALSEDDGWQDLAQEFISTFDERGEDALTRAFDLGDESADEELVALEAELFDTVFKHTVKDLLRIETSGHCVSWPTCSG